MSPNPSDEYFADGLTEELIDRLSQVKGLEVIARTSVMTYKNKDKKISEIGRELRVGSIIEGSVRKAGNKIRATVNLIDSSSESRLWSSRYDKDLDDIFAIQSDIAANVTGSIPASLGLDANFAEEKETEDIVAYTYFLQARELLHQSSESSVNDALILFEKATQRDPKLAKAYVEQAECYKFLGMFGTISFQKAIDEARKCLSKALSIREDNAEAHASLSAVEMMEDNVMQGEAEARRAIELNPNLADAYSNLASIMMVRGDLEESIRLREKAYELDPLEPWNMTSLGDEYFWSGREVEALEIWKISLKLAPYMTYDSMLDYYLKVGDYAKAASIIEILKSLEPGNPENDFWEGYLAALQGDREKAMRIIKVLEKSAAAGAVTINGEALIYCALGDMDNFFELEQKAGDSHRLSVSVLRYSPLAARARQDPRTRKLLEKFERKIV